MFPLLVIVILIVVAGALAYYIVRIQKIRSLESRERFKRKQEDLVKFLKK